MDFENKKNEIEKSSQKQKTENKENLDISDVLNEGKQQLSNAVETASNENKQLISDVENYSGVESGDIKVAQEIVAETNKEVNRVVENSKKNVSEIVGEGNETNQEKYREIYKRLNAHGADDLQSFNLLDDESIQEIDKKVAYLENDGSFINAPEILARAIQGYKNREIYNLKEGIPQESTPGEKFNFIENKINDLDDKGQLHGNSAKQLTSLFKQVLRGEKTITDLKESSFTLGKNKIPLALDSLAEGLLLDIPINNMNLLKRVAKSLDLSKSYMDEIEKIEKGEYVRPEGGYGVLIEKANEIMGLKKPRQKHNSDSQWTDPYNPPTRWDKNAKVGDKINK